MANFVWVYVLKYRFFLKKHTELLHYLDTGPVTSVNATERDRFVKVIESLEPHGGGDCPELAFKGMIDAINEGPLDGSPLYVFTDARPKDHTAVNVELLTANLAFQEIITNFFAFDGSECSRVEQFSPFQEIAHVTSGQVFVLKNADELKHFHNFTITSLVGTAILDTAVRNRRSKRKKRSTSSKSSMSYIIPVDDSIDTLVISVTTDRSSKSGKTWNVSLNSPGDTIAGIASSNLDMGTVYHISRPSVGMWSLYIEAETNVGYDFVAKGSTKDNIDFKVYFVRTTVRRGINRTIPITSPLQGKSRG